MPTVLIILSGNLISFLIYIFASHAALNRRFRLPLTILIYLGSAAIVLAYGWFFEISTPLSERRGRLLRVVIWLILYYIPLLAAYKDKWYQDLFFCGMAFVILTISDQLAVAITIPSGVLTGCTVLTDLPAALLTSEYIASSAFSIAFMWLLVLAVSRWKKKLSLRELALFLIFPFSQAALLLGWQSALAESFSPQRFVAFFFAIVLSLIADSLLFTAARRIAEQHQLKAKNSLLEKQVELQKQHYSAVTEQYESIRHLRHDIANHLSAMEALLHNGNLAEAEAYTNEIASFYDSSSHLGVCENPVVDAFLAERRSKLEAEGICLQLSVSVPIDISIENAALISAFGNMLDNAAEACLHTEEKVIRLLSAVRKGGLYLETQNAVPPNNQLRKERIPGLSRGIGHEILRELATTYHGRFQAEIRGGVYYACLFLNPSGQTVSASLIPPPAVTSDIQNANHSIAATKTV